MAKWFKAERPSRQEVLRAQKLRARLALILPAAFVVLGSLFLYPFYVLAEMPANDTISSVALILILGLIGLVLWNNARLLKINEDLIKLERRYSDFISAQHLTVSRLVGKQALGGTEWDEMRRNMVREIARLMDVERVSLWLYDDKTNTMSLEMRYLRDSRSFDTEEVLDGQIFTRHFAALERGQYIDAHDAQNDPRMAAFVGSYLKPNDIRSILDIKLLIDGQMGGLLTCEQVGRLRRWTAADIGFGARIADMVSLAYEARLMRILRDSAEQDGKTN